ncbi:MAG: PTS sugar transporter subunit IIA, partial [Thermanaerothrix sp.]|nr:PTS sugar transporter subunit IIA [Thermanaerothrix sp.]
LGMEAPEAVFAQASEVLSERRGFSDLDRVNLFICAVFSVLRSSEGMFPEDSQDGFWLLAPHDLEMAREVLALVADGLGLGVHESDVRYLGCLISLFRRRSPGELNRDRLRTFQDSYYLTLTEWALARLQDECGFDFTGDDRLVTGLALHVKMLRRRAMAGHRVRNPMLEDLRRRYPLTFEVAVLFLKHLSGLSGLEFQEDEAGFVAMHFGGAFERMAREEERRMGLAVVCPSGEASAGLLMDKLKALYGGRVRLLGPFSFAQRSLLKVMDLKCVVSTVPMEVEGVPVVHVSPFFDRRDQEALENLLFVRPRLKGLSDVLKGLFREDLFVPSMDAGSPEESIEILSKLLWEAGLVPKGYMEGVLERERLLPTSLGNLVAVPHSVRMEAFESAVAVGILRRPVQWGDHRVRLVMLFAPRRGAREEARALYEAVGRLIEDPGLVGRLLKSRSHGEFMERLFGCFISR